MDSLLTVTDLHAAIGGKPILKGVNLSVPEGMVVVVMGPNGSGKSTLANVLMGNAKYEVTEGKVKLSGKDILGLPPDERSRKGLFLSFQHPVAVPGVTVSGFLRAALESHRGKVSHKALKEEMGKALDLLGLDASFASRYVNVGFSGGERKRLEMAQMLLLAPRLSILDETDSGLDIDALRTVATAVNSARDGKRSFLIITHYARILKLIEPDIIYILMDGHVVHKGGPELADTLEEKGYGWLEKGKAVQSRAGDKA